MKFINFFFYNCGSFLPSWIQGPHRIRIQSECGSTATTKKVNIILKTRNWFRDRPLTLRCRESPNSWTASFPCRVTPHTTARAVVASLLPPPLLPPSSRLTNPPIRGRPSNPPISARHEMTADCWAVKFSPSWCIICRMGISVMISRTWDSLREMRALMRALQAGRRWRERSSRRVSSTRVEEWGAERATRVPRPRRTFIKSALLPTLSQNILLLIKKIIGPFVKLHFFSRKLDKFLNHFRVKICGKSSFLKFIHNGKVKATKLFQNSAFFRPFLWKFFDNSAADLSGQSLFYSAPFELCGRKFGQLATPEVSVCCRLKLDFPAGLGQKQNRLQIKSGCGAWLRQ